MATNNIPYYRQLQRGMAVQQMQPHHAEQLGALQQLVFPTLSAGEWMRAEQYLHHLTIFPEGQFVVTADDGVIGMTSSIQAIFSTAHHTFKEISGGGWFTSHNPQGDWLYGLDMGIHPDYRGRGLARELYRARHYMAKQAGLKGQYTVGMMNGYGALAGTITAEQYFEELTKGLRTDPTISAQMKIGFEPVCLVPDYLTDPACGNYGVLLKIDIDKII